MASSVRYKWKHQLSVGINESLKNTKPVKSPYHKKPEEEEQGKLKEVILRQVFNDHEPEKKRWTWEDPRHIINEQKKLDSRRHRM